MGAWGSKMQENDTAADAVLSLNKFISFYEANFSHLAEPEKRTLAVRMAIEHAAMTDKDERNHRNSPQHLGPVWLDGGFCHEVLGILDAAMDNDIGIMKCDKLLGLAIARKLRNPGFLKQWRSMKERQNALDDFVIRLEKEPSLV